MTFKPVAAKVDFPKLEEKILKFWKKNKIFEKSVKQRPKAKEFVFYDGPPFATGLPHYGHIVPGTLKDIIPRYWTMKGYRVERRFGWDCHGLPVEYELEKELEIKDKKAIEEMGMAKFNEACRKIVLRYTKEWEKIVPRLGRWVDFKNDYRTMDPDYMESIWWVVKTLWEKNLIYEGYKSLHICPRCATPISNFEVTQGYKDKKDKSVVVKFELLKNPGTFLLVWTTTPWTLPGNVLLAVSPKIKYAEVTEGGKRYILAKDKIKEIFGKRKVTSVKEVSVKKLIGQKYKPLFEISPSPKGGYRVVAAEFVSGEEGTGIVHIAPAFGEDDLLLGQKEKVPFIQHISTEGRVNNVLSKFKGISVFDFNEKIVEELSQKGLLFSSFDLVHAYPHCWRCETPLLNYATKTWFVAVTKIKDRLMANNQKIRWVPAHIKRGRFGKWLEEVRDWAISRNRFWGTPLPIWRCEKTGEIEVIGSIKELERKSGRKVRDLHLHKINKLTWINPRTGGKMRLSGEVLDCWFESGSMPYAFNHYPFENKKWFEEHFPADFIAESIDQTRGWFYTLHVLASALFDKPAFKNVVTNGIVLAEDGQKMSKRKKNYPDPIELVGKYGADALRFYLMSSAVIKGEDICFSEKGVDRVVRSVFLTFWNSYRFFITYASLDKWRPRASIKNATLIDRWILARLNEVIVEITKSLEEYDVSRALKGVPSFVEDLSTWYIRRSRDRVGPTAENKEDKEITYSVLYTVLTALSRLLAPFVPFLAEEMYQGLKWQSGKVAKWQSVHLEDWPKAGRVDRRLLGQMVLVRKICELGHAGRKKAGIRVRQPLKKLKIKNEKLKIGDELIVLIKEELNVKEVVFERGRREKEVTRQKLKHLGGQAKFQGDKDIKVQLDTKIIPELKAEGEARELVRQIQDLRKKAGCRLDQKIKVYGPEFPKEKNLREYIKKKTLTKELLSGRKLRIVSA